MTFIKDFKKGVKACGDPRFYVSFAGKALMYKELPSSRTY
jgi:hypothetical protein